MVVRGVFYFGPNLAFEREREREVYFSDIKCYKVYSDGTTWNTQKFTRIDLDGYLEFAFLCIIIQKFLHVDYS